MQQNTALIVEIFACSVLLSVQGFEKGELGRGNGEDRTVLELLSKQRAYFEQKLADQQRVFEGRLARQEDRINVQETKLLQQHHAIKQLTHTVHRHTYAGESDLTASQPIQLNAKRQISGPVAFYATTDQGEIPHLHGNQRIPLDLVLMNYGSGYNKSRLSFSAPRSGIYMFTTTIMAYRGYNALVQVQIIKDGVVLGSTYAHGQTDQYAQGSVTVTTHLDVGNDVYIAVDYALNDVTLYGHRYTSFTGFLVYP